MGHFVPPHDKLTATLVGTRSGRDLWRLEKPLAFYSDVLGLIQVRPGFETDGASVPRLPFMYWWYGGKATRESAIHDYLYEVQRIAGVEITREQADAVFLEAGGPRGMWLGIRAGGWLHWKDHKEGKAICGLKN